jgi:hypothetical protein
MYPSGASLSDKPQVKGFMDYTIENNSTIADTANIVPLTSEQETAAQEALTTAEAQ